MRVLLVVAAATAAVFFSLLTGTWYGLIAAAVFVLAALLRLRSDDKRVLLLATGELLVIAVAGPSFLGGVIVQCAVIGAVVFDGEGMPYIRDSILFGLFCIAALGGALILDLSNQVLLPFLALTAGVAGATAVLVTVQELRERRTYSGGHT
jgi:hypothetical protein